MRALLVYNAYSGRSKFTNKISIIREELAKVLDIHLFESFEPRAITNYIIKNGPRYDMVIAAGGDGTVHEAINGIMALDKRMRLAVIPLGTCNDLAKSLGYKKNFKKSLNIIKENNIVAMDVSEINNNYFIYGLAAGRLTEISYRASHGSKALFGKLSYYASVLKILRSTKPISCKITLDGKLLDYNELSLFLATNSRYLAGFRLRRKNKIYLNDNKLQVLLIDRVGKLHSSILFARALLLGEFKSRHVKYMDASEIKIESEALIDYNTDGELLDNQGSIHVKIKNRAIDVVANKKIIDKYFLKD